MNTHGTFRSPKVARALLPLMLLFAFTGPATAEVAVSIIVAPPALPVYVQPPCPADGYIWIPGEPGLLWTPGYWAWEGVQFVFHEGYWGPHVGFYGGINYGFGYGGIGFEGGYWRSGRFYYNRAIANVSESSVHNIYTKTVIHNTINVISYNGGSGGTTTRPTTAELRAATERHLPPVAAQSEHMKMARNARPLRAASNHVQPPIAASQREAQDMHARQQRERQELRDRQAAEQAEMERQHAGEERRQAMAAAHARQQQELARRYEQEEQELEAGHKRRYPE